MIETEILGLGIRPYISLLRSARPSGSGYVLEQGPSRIIFDLSSFYGKLIVTVLSKRISGNGKATINGQEVNILSKIQHKTDVSLINNKLLEIERSNDANGKIIISGLCINCLDEDDNIIETVDRMPDIWKSVLSHCGKIRGIKLVQDKLIAVEGAYIQRADLIESIKTDPHEAFSFGDNIKFIFPCHIVNIILKSNVGNLSIPKPIYQHMTAPPKIVSGNPNNQLEEYIPLSGHSYNAPRGIERITGTSNNSVVFDSSSMTLNPATLQNVNDIIAGHGSSGKGLLLGRNGKFGIPLSSIQPHIQYVVAVNVKKVSGNGKLALRFSATDGTERDKTVLICPDKESQIYLKLNSGEAPVSGASYLLDVFRPINMSVGEVNIDRIMVIQGIHLVAQNLHPMTDGTYDNAHPFLVASIHKDANDLIEATSKHYARWTSHTNATTHLNNQANLQISTLSGMSWHAKIKTLCPNITVTNKEPYDLVIGALDSLKPAQRVWLDAFNGNSISDYDDAILGNANLIGSPSLQNVEFLKDKYSNKEIKHIERPWPFLNNLPPIQYPNGEYMFFIHRKDDITKRLLEAWTDDMPKLVVVGARLNMPHFVIPVNEYITYDKLLNIMLGSKLIIDLPICDDYLSAYLSMAFDCGLPVITSNWLGMIQNNCKFIVCKDKLNELNLPAADDLKISIQDGLGLTKGSGIGDLHNYKLANFFNNMLA